jgi:hypothetical protein
MPELRITADVIGMPELCITGDLVGMPEIYITAEVVGILLQTLLECQSFTSNVFAIALQY